MSEINRQWRLASWPDGKPRGADWELTETSVPDPRAGEMLVRSIYLDVAPYMRGRISPNKNYAAGVKPGEVMIGGGLGRVVKSNVRDYAAGDFVVSDFAFGWQDYAVLRPAVLRRVDPQLA